MLSWDDSSKPALQPAMPSFPPSGPSADRFADLSSFSGSPVNTVTAAPSPVMTAATGTSKRVNAADPRQPAALWHLGVEAAKRGAMEEAVGLWERLLTVLPGDAEDARLVRSAIEAVRRK